MPITLTIDDGGNLHLDEDNPSQVCILIVSGLVACYKDTELMKTKIDTLIKEVEEDGTDS